MRPNPDIPNATRMAFFVTNQDMTKTTVEAPARVSGAMAPLRKFERRMTRFASARFVILVMCLMNTIPASAAATDVLATHTTVRAQTLNAECTQEDAHAAEVVIDYLTTWDNIHRFYSQFKQCYDGAIAGSVQDKVQLLWANRWQQLPRMLALTRKDAEFRSFIWAMVDSEAFPQDAFAKVLAHATRRCPRSASQFCQAIRSADRRRRVD